MDADVARNGRHVMRQMLSVREQGADVAHFPEACLSGYVGSDFPSYDGFDWDLLERVTRRILALAGELRLWVVFGSTHRLTGNHKPHNSLYVVDATGSIVDRYDKRFCAGDPEERTGDLAHYTPGNHLSMFTINGVRCGALICHDYRYPELYREYRRRDIQLIFHSYHAAHMTSGKMAEIRAAIGADVQRFNPGSTYPGITMPATMIAEAAANHVWISCPNSSARESCWGAFFVRADGVTTGRLPRNRTGVLISTLDTEAALYDSTAAWRTRAMSGVLHSGTLVHDPRSEQRTQL
ncbi:carbon-nitrogen hydrolase family protein [Parafrankia sp. FMc2]|uniref:carbon-nitrogen hydrolase family protein n=1 Tax=Parafrankia sp. FMc2 TaxID=3233196 RepID=UPI0034D57F23